MLPYKFINIPKFDEIQQQLILLLPKVFKEIKTSAYLAESNVVLSACPALKEFFEKNSLVWDIARFFMTAPNDQLPIHVDGDKQYPKFLALNLPIVGCENSTMNWWEHASYAETLNTGRYYGATTDMYDSNGLPPTHTCSLTTPALVQINVPHNAINPQEHERVILSIRFKPEPTELWYS